METQRLGEDGQSERYPNLRKRVCILMGACKLPGYRDDSLNLAAGLAQKNPRKGSGLGAVAAARTWLGGNEPVRLRSGRDQLPGRRVPLRVRVDPADEPVVINDEDCGDQ